ncbi:hypothetical protein O4H49_08380 [Kiloniella laminariae]|uniref:Uncharacterized protein n=1 Tax=Kiloniella laminariae TaxID=454162 RepID=A0ABT4LI81_9PROT|nr:hypothetical protein [Kiloniella laminariae]MCZ4280791.1 hypothetical protein [Kiloniella laminariae]
MTTGTAVYEDHLPKWLWLALPVALAVLLLILGLFMPGELYDQWIGNERNGILETSHTIIPAISFFLALRILFHPNLRNFSWLWFWILIAALGSFYMSGEEASWGQHWFQWSTSSDWAAINDQGETNFHNTSSWLDQKPRTILEIGILVGGIILPLLFFYRPALWNHPLAIVVPTFHLFPTALIAEITRMTERLLAAMDSSFRLFQRASEVQELFFALFVLFYLILFLRRLKELKRQVP